MKKTPALDYFLEHAQRFTRTSAGFIGYDDTVRAQKASFEVSLTELLDFNENLPILLTSLEVESRKARFQSWGGLALRATLAHWEKPGPAHPVQTEWAVTFISRVNLLEDTKELDLAATLYQTSMHVAGFEQVTRLRAERTRVPFTWAEQHWPGVVGRVKAARALDYDERKTAVMAFTDSMQPVAPTSLDGLTF